MEKNKFYYVFNHVPVVPGFITGRQISLPEFAQTAMRVLPDCFFLSKRQKKYLRALVPNIRISGSKEKIRHTLTAIHGGQINVFLVVDEENPGRTIFFRFDHVMKEG